MEQQQEKDCYITITPYDGKDLHRLWVTEQKRSMLMVSIYRTKTSILGIKMRFQWFSYVLYPLVESQMMAITCPTFFGNNLPINLNNCQTLESSYMIEVPF